MWTRLTPRVEHDIVRRGERIALMELQSGAALASDQLKRGYLRDPMQAG